MKKDHKKRKSKRRGEKSNRMERVSVKRNNGDKDKEGRRNMDDNSMW